MPAAPRISVLVPCFNLGAYLDEAVDSVLAQTVQDFEIIVVDDGSTDPSTRALLADYRRPHTRVLRAPNRGLARARNLALEHARGALLCALDADDKLHPRYFEKALAAFDADPGLTFVSCWLQMFGTQEGLWKQDRCDLPTLLQEDTVMTAALVRATAVREAGGWDPDMPAQGDEDWDLWLGLVERGRRGRILPEVLFFYRRRGGSMGDACTRTPTHLALLRYLARKHQASYAAHCEGLLETKARLATEADRAGATHAARARTWLAPMVELRRAEVARLEALVAEVDAAAQQARRVAELEARLAAAHRRIEALLDSKSWKVTAPLRAAWELLAVPRRPSGDG